MDIQQLAVFGMTKLNDSLSIDLKSESTILNHEYYQIKMILSAGLHEHYFHDLPL